jgi:2-polyprenyl-3-methyl-5-hydroxy-6-metoxy-1,4-benzoquinol methylase
VKRALLAIADSVAPLWGLIPGRLRRGLLFGLFILEGRQRSAADGLRNLFAVQDRLNLALNERAAAYGNGEHPKHRLTRYHDFFVERIPPDAKVLDVGCGYGAVARSIATRLPYATVLGVDLDEVRLRQARAAVNPPNLRFQHGDATRGLPSGPWDVVVLSNILEHVDRRTEFLAEVLREAQPQRVLVRVPLFERDWQMPMRKELGIGWFSDPTHFVEHSLDEFAAEIAAAGLQVVEQRTIWGEIWADCRPQAVAPAAPPSPRRARES